MKAVLDHEIVCEGKPKTMAPLTAANNHMKLLTPEIDDKSMKPEATKKQSTISEEDVGFGHTSTGR